MTTKWYRAEIYAGGRIVPVQVERATEASVYINRRRHAICGSFEQYFQTWPDAHQWLLQRAEKQIVQLRTQLTEREGDTEKIRAMKPEGAK